MPDKENLPLDSEDWQVVFQAYEECPILAFILAQHFECIKGLIRGGPQKAIEAMAIVDQAIESLMPHTNFRDSDRSAYLLAVAGKLKPQQDETIRGTPRSKGE